MSGFDAARRAAVEGDRREFRHDGADYERVGRTKVYRRSPGTEKRRRSARQAVLGSFEAARRGAAGAGHKRFKHNGRTYERLAGSDVYRKSAERRGGWNRALAAYNEGNEEWCTPRRGTAAYDRVAAIRERLQRGYNRPTRHHEKIRAPKAPPNPRAHVKHEAPHEARHEAQRHEAQRHEARHERKHAAKHHRPKHAPHRKVKPEPERPTERPPPQRGLLADAPTDSDETTESSGSSESGEGPAPEYYYDNDDDPKLRDDKHDVMVQRRERARLQTIERERM
jgi:hypothetical protein